MDAWQDFMESEEAQEIQGAMDKILTEEDRHAMNIMLILSISNARKLLSAWADYMQNEDPERERNGFQTTMSWTHENIDAVHQMLHVYEEARDRGDSDNDEDAGEDDGDEDAVQES